MIVKPMNGDEYERFGVIELLDDDLDFNDLGACFWDLEGNLITD